MSARQAQLDRWRAEQVLQDAAAEIDEPEQENQGQVLDAEHEDQGEHEDVEDVAEPGSANVPGDPLIDNVYGPHGMRQALGRRRDASVWEQFGRQL